MRIEKQTKENKVKTISNDFMKGFFWGIVFAIIWYLQADPLIATDFQRGDVEWKPIYVYIVNE